MPKKKSFTTPVSLSDLRALAEKRHQVLQLKRPDYSSSPEDILRNSHELEVYQIELELQQDELIQSREELSKSKAEQEESLRRFTELYDFAPLGYVTLLRDSRIVEANLTATKIIGLSRSQLRGNLLTNLFNPQDSQVINALLEKVFTKKQHGYCEATLLPDNSVHLKADQSFAGHIFRIDAVISDSSCECRAILTDVTDQKISENALKQSQYKFRMLFEGHSSIMLVIDESGNIIDANPAAATFYGWPIEKLCTMHLDTITTRSHEAVMSDLLKFKASKQNRFTTLHRKADGSLHDVEVVQNTIAIGSNMVFYCIMNDITERKQAESQLKKLSLALQQSPTVVVITDPEGNIEYVNHAFSAHTGYSAEEARGKNPRILKSGLMPDSFYEDLWQTILSGRIWRGEMQNKKKNGELFWERAVISAMMNNDGVVTNFVAVKEDITAEKKLWDELTAAKDHAEESDRLKSAFLANISHEIRTPMNGILGFSEILKDPHLTGEEQEEFISLIQKSGNRMLNLITELIDISLYDAGETTLQITDTPVNALLHDLYAFFKPESEVKRLSLNCTCALSDEESTIETDSGKLTRILTSLIQNALTFTSTGTIDFGYTRIGSSLEFYVLDTGIGVPAAMQQKIFERFRQADDSLTRNYEGSGLGLSSA